MSGSGGSRNDDGGATGGDRGPTDPCARSRRVYSDDLPGLILVGKNRAGIIASILPAARAILAHKGEDASDVRVDTTVVR